MYLVSDGGHAAEHPGGVSATVRARGSVRARAQGAARSRYAPGGRCPEPCPVPRPCSPAAPNAPPADYEYRTVPGTRTSMLLKITSTRTSTSTKPSRKFAYSYSYPYSHGTEVPMKFDSDRDKIRTTSTSILRCNTRTSYDSSAGCAVSLGVRHRQHTATTEKQRPETELDSQGNHCEISELGLAYRNSMHWNHSSPRLQK